MIVVDGSTVLEAVVADHPDPELVHRVASDGDLHAPHLVDLEVLHVLRRLVRRGEVSLDRANDARLDVEALRLTRYPHAPITDRIWELCNNLSAYDASYVALAEVLGIPLVTTDRALAHAPGVTATVELYAVG